MYGGQRMGGRYSSGRRAAVGALLQKAFLEAGKNDFGADVLNCPPILINFSIWSYANDSKNKICPPMLMPEIK